MTLFTDYTAASSALFALLTAFIIWGHFRAGKGEEFTLARIATALDNSDIPSRFGQMKREVDAGRWEENVMQEYGGRMVTLDKNDETLRILSPAS
jgi:hypothetical protein